MSELTRNLIQSRSWESAAADIVSGHVSGSPNLEFATARALQAAYAEGQDRTNALAVIQRGDPTTVSEYAVRIQIMLQRWEHPYRVDIGPDIITQSAHTYEEVARQAQGLLQTERLEGTYAGQYLAQIESDARELAGHYREFTALPSSAARSAFLDKTEGLADGLSERCNFNLRLLARAPELAHATALDSSSVYAALTPKNVAHYAMEVAWNRDLGAMVRIYEANSNRPEVSEAIRTEAAKYSRSERGEILGWLAERPAWFTPPQGVQEAACAWFQSALSDATRTLQALQR